MTRNYDLGQTPHIDSTESHTGDASLFFYSGTISESHYSMVITPPIEASTLEGTYLRLWMKASSTAVKLEVGVCEDTSRYYRAFVPLDTINVAQGGHWQEFVINLSTYTGTGRRIGLRLQRSLQTAASECFIDDLSISNCGTTMPWVNHVTSTSLTVNYNAYGTGNVTVSCGNQVVTDASSPTTFNGLSPETEYSITVSCDEGMEQSVTATTLEGAGLIPAYFESFDSMPANWRYPFTCTPSVSNGILTMIPSVGDSCLAVLPLHDAGATNEFDIALRLKGEGIAKLIIGVMDYANEPESFVAIDTMQITSQWQTHLCSLDSYTGNGRYIALLAVGSGIVNIDYLRIAHCLFDGVRLYNITNQSVTLTWDTLTTEASARIILFPTNDTTSITQIIPNSNPITIDGLEPATEYSIYVASACLDSLCDYDKHLFTTFAHEVTVPYCTGFEEDGQFPLGWVSVDNTADITSNSYHDQYGLTLNSIGIVTLPLISVSGSDTLMLDFYASGNSSIIVGIQDNPYSEFQPIDTIGIGLQWQHVSIPVTNCAFHCLALRSTNTVSIDDLALRRNSVMNAWVSDIDTASATFTWQTAYDDSVMIEYSDVDEEGGDFAAGMGIRLDSICSTLTLDNLVPGSAYSVHIAPLEGDITCNYTTLHFRTMASSVPLPYCTNFDNLSSGGFPFEWRRLSLMGEYPIASTERNHSKRFSLRFSATAAKPTAAILPNITTCSEHAILSFWTNATRNLSGAMLLIGTMDNISDLSTFTAIDTITFSTTDKWQPQMVDLDTLRQHIALMLIGGSSSETRLFIDDLCIQPCVAYNVRVSNIDSTQFTVNWDGIGTSGIICQAKRGSQIRLTDTLYTSPAVVTGLTAGQAYTITLRALCECGHAGGTLLRNGGPTGNASTDSIRSISINTVARPVLLPYCTGFEIVSSGQFPSLWHRIGPSSVTDQYYHDGGRSLMVAGGTTLLLPSMDNLSDLTTVLYAYATDESALDESAIVLGTMQHVDSLSSFIPTDTLHLSHMGRWERLVGDLAADNGNGRYIVLKYNAPASSTLFIDDINISQCAIANASISADGVLTWNGLHNPEGIAIEFGMTGFDPETGTPDTAYTSPHTISGFPAGTTVEVHMQTLCTDHTACDDLKVIVGGGTTIPYCEYFDATAGNAMPIDWIVSRTYNATPVLTTLEENKVLNLKAYSTNRSIVALPKPTNADIRTLQLNFSMLSTNSNRTRLLVGEIENPSDPNTFIATDTIGNTADGIWQRFRIPLNQFSHTDWHPAVGCLSLNQDAELWLDSISVTRAVTPQASVIGARSILLQSDSLPYIIEYGEEGFEQGSGETLIIDTTVFTINNLLPEHTYQIYTLEEAGEATCMAPVNISMPDETALPYCQSDLQFSRLQLPELSIDSINQLHIYLTLRGGTPVEVGVMDASGDWDHLFAVDTIIVPTGTWQDVHLSLQQYHGHGRFVALRTTTGGIATASTMTLTECELPTVVMNPDNTVSLTGSGSVEYGPTGFTPGNGTIVDITSQPTIVDNLDDNTTYDFYPICNDKAPCYSPIAVTTTLSASLPYCTTLGGHLPEGWATSTNAANTTPVQILDSCLSVSVNEGQTVTLVTPHIATSSVAIDIEMLSTSNDVVLVIGGDSVRNTGTGSWQQHRLATTHNGRIAMTVCGNGTLALRNLLVDICSSPQEFTISQPGDGLVTLEWDTTGTDPEAMLLYTLGTQNDGTTIPIGTPPLTLSLLPDTTYSLYLRCSEASTCRQPIHITTLAAPVSVPYCYINHGEEGSLLPEGWRVADGNYLVLPQFADADLHELNIEFIARMTGSTGLNLTLGTLLNANDTSTFDSLATFTSVGDGYVHCFYTFDNYFGGGHFIALHTNDGSLPVVDSVSVSRCAAYDLYMSETEADHVVFDWGQQGNPTVSVEYGEHGFASGSGTSISATAPPLRIDGLSALENYAFYVTYSCDDNPCRQPWIDTFFIFTPQGGSGCIDYTDLRASYVTCRYGSYTNPNERTGAIDHGYTSPQSRHTIHFDTAERDLRTNSLLRTIPEGAQASVRLGNWTTGGNGAPEAESITYALNIDSSEFDLLILKYAAVLQDPEHSASLQPRFRLQILNTQGELIDSCGMADFIANHNLGWHEAPGEVLWKNWTTVGIDLTHYSGQTILIRLTTNDCGEGSHFGYAYFTLGCSRKSMRTEGCSNVPSYRFTVPDGFNYRWYTNFDSLTTISDSASIIVPSDNSVTYFCNLSFIDNPSCSFTMSAFSGARFALALMDTTLINGDCRFTLQLGNQSTISSDGSTPDGSGDPVDSITWFLPDTIIHDNQYSLEITDTGYYPVTLVAGIADNRCTDTLSYNIHIVWPHKRPVIEGRLRRCTAEVPDTLSVLYTTEYHWADNSVGDIVIAPPHDTTFIAYTADSNGCLDTLSHTLRVYSSYHTAAIDSICASDTTYLWRDSTLILSHGLPSEPPALPSARYTPFQPLLFTDTLTTIDLCDSSFALTLQPMPHYFIEHRDTICHDSPFAFFDTTLLTSGSYLHSGATAYGCDSLVTQHLHVIQRSFTNDVREACDSMRWINGNLYTDNVDGEEYLLHTPYGCDSVVRLYLTVNPSAYHLDTDTACAGTSYSWRNHVFTNSYPEETTSTYVADTLYTIHNCDSILALSLTRLPLPQIGIRAERDCQLGGYTLHAETNVDHLVWTSWPFDLNLTGHEYDSAVHVNPIRRSNTYTLFADYSPTPLCPTSTKITLLPYTPPVAKLRVSPATITDNKPDFEATDLSPNYGMRLWMIDGEPLDDTSRHIGMTAPAGIDSLGVMLVIGDGYCTDTASRTIVVERSALAIPNAFTPTQESNNHFFVSGLNIHSFEIHIYDRRGVLVYHSTNINEGWNGYGRNGVLCPPANYAFIIHYSTIFRPTAIQKEVGTVLLIR